MIIEKQNFIRRFDNHNDYESFTGSTSYTEPNVSLCEAENEVHYNPIVPPSYEYIEIGGKKWATMNVGANSVTDTGLYFQWADISGYTVDQVGTGEGQKYFGWDDYKYVTGINEMTKYNDTDGKTVLDLSDDPVFANWGGAWRTPTAEEYEELLSATTSAWTTDYQGTGVSGVVLTDKTDSSKALFFPITGRLSFGHQDQELYGYYWTSSVDTSKKTNGRNFQLSTESSKLYQWIRCLGLPVRGISDE